MKVERLVAAGLLWSTTNCSLALDFDRSQLRAGDTDVSIDRDAYDGATDVAADFVADAEGADACAVHLESDPLNCGRCGMRCGTNELCASGACVRTECRASLTACGSQCVDLLTHVQHCGSCATSCDPGAQRCCQGVCQARCM